MPTLYKLDPSRTATLRRSFAVDMARRFAAVRRLVWQSVYLNDAFGLNPEHPITIHAAIPPRAFEFRTNPQKVEAFRGWLQEQTNAGILSVDGQGAPWLSKYIHSSYKKGKLRAYREKYGPLVDSPAGLKMTDDGRMLGLSFTGPEEVKRVEALYTRAWNDLKGVTDTMASQLSRSLSNGFAAGLSPIDIARDMVKTVDNLSSRRAELIARTEVIAAHAEGQLDGYEELGASGVRVDAELMTAGDYRVCEICQSHDGQVISIQEARNLVPFHPGCRCAWAPVTTDVWEKAKDKVSSIRKAEPSAKPRGEPGSVQTVPKLPVGVSGTSVERTLEKMTDSERGVLEEWFNGGQRGIQMVEKGGSYFPTKWEAEQASAFNRALDKLPKYEGTVYRGVQMSPRDTSAIEIFGKMRAEFSQSATLDRGVAAAFADPSFDVFAKKPGMDNVILEIRSKTACNVSGASSKLSEWGWQKEVVMRKGTEYKLVESKEETIRGVWMNAETKKMVNLKPSKFKVLVLEEI